MRQLAKLRKSPLPLREGDRGRGFSQLGLALDCSKPTGVRGRSKAHPRADARKPLPLPPSRKGRGD